jgi:hypothetical protein
MIKIDDVLIPTPSEFKVGIQDLSQAERNAAGTIIIERVRGGVRKLEMSWKHLSASDLQQLLSAVSPVFFTVEYPDPLTGSARTGTFYVGDRSVGSLNYLNGQPRWIDCKFNVIER